MEKKHKAINTQLKYKYLDPVLQSRTWVNVFGCFPQLLLTFVLSSNWDETGLTIKQSDPLIQADESFGESALTRWGAQMNESYETFSQFVVIRQHNPGRSLCWAFLSWRRTNEWPETDSSPLTVHGAIPLAGRCVFCCQAGSALKRTETTGVTSCLFGHRNEHTNKLPLIN